MKSVMFCIFSLFISALPIEAGTLSTVGNDRWVKVSRVIDGDTFRTAGGEKVRLLGINAPEIAHGTKPGQPGGLAAKKALTSRIHGKMVRLKFGREHRDRYGRLLAHIYLRDSTWVNGELVKSGHALVYTFAPNFRRAKDLLREEKSARRSLRGIWSMKRFRMLSSERVGRTQIGQFRVIRGKVVARKSHYSWKLSGGFSVTIPRKRRKDFIGVPEIHLNDEVMVRGKVRVSRSGGYGLSIYTAFDVEVL
ncbi:MAG: thermonuclease family protein [Mariprofundaceae bacterium]